MATTGWIVCPLRCRGPAFPDAASSESDGTGRVEDPPCNATLRGTPYWPLDLRRWRPVRGERVLALGFPDLDAEEGREERPISQYLYGSFGEITDVEPADGARGRPWPVIRLAAEWPGGMSGGPVFNESGNVIGVVSSGIAGGTGTATFFSGWNMAERIMGSIDPNNPGRLPVSRRFRRCRRARPRDAGCRASKALRRDSRADRPRRRFCRPTPRRLDASERAMVTRMSWERSHRETAPSNKRHHRVGRQLDHETRTRNRTLAWH
ncbi:serine protease [Bradyrhizobium sp. WSM3983]|uniref:S1 family peptidase n=1 Tax=Bradyrhizobium sp. WSM3983 TaxID=1038867 RepID=UPI000A02E9BC